MLNVQIYEHRPKFKSLVQVLVPALMDEGINQANRQCLPLYI